MKNTKKMFEIKILVLVSLSNDNYDMDLLTFKVFGLNKHDAIFNLMSKNLTNLIQSKHNDKLVNLSSHNEIYWDDILYYEFIELKSIKILF